MQIFQGFWNRQIRLFPRNWRGFASSIFPGYCHVGPSPMKSRESLKYVDLLTSLWQFKHPIQTTTAVPWLWPNDYFAHNTLEISRMKRLLYIYIYILYILYVIYIYTYTDYIVTLTHLKHHPSDHQVVGPMPAGGLSDFFPVPAARLGVEKLRHRRCSNEYNWGYSILWGCIKTYIPIFGKMNIHESQLFLGKGARVLTHSHKITGGDGLWFLPTNWNMELPSGSWEIDLWRMFHIDFDLLESSICMYLLYIDTFHELDANFLWFWSLEDLEIWIVQFGYVR